MNTTQTRADRNNNPTAFTTDVAEEAGLVLGRDYAVGDVFQEERHILSPFKIDCFTARLLPVNPVLMTIQVIDTVTFYTKIGTSRWAYINMSPELWKILSFYEKRFVIAIMYLFEGGTELNQFLVD